MNVEASSDGTLIGLADHPGPDFGDIDTRMHIVAEMTQRNIR
jgi:hypothetical protein